MHYEIVNLVFMHINNNELSEMNAFVSVNVCMHL